MKPEYYFFGANGLDGERFPSARLKSLSPKIIGTTTSELCGHTRALHYGGDVTLYVEDYDYYPPAIEWPDVLDGSPSYPKSFFVSKRVLQVLHREGITGVVENRATVIESRCKVLSLPAPQYFYLDVYNFIDIDLVKSKIQGPPPCPGCNARDGYAEAERLIPVPSSSKAYDFARVRNFPQGNVFCSLQVIELARRERWTNILFKPIDILTRHSYGFRGIDYLGEQWPPEKWYPDPPHAGRTIEQWLAALASEDRDDSYRATLAFLELADIKQAEPAVAGLVQMFQTGDPTRRYRAANILKGFARRGTPVPPEIIPDVEHEMRDG